MKAKQTILHDSIRPSSLLLVSLINYACLWKGYYIWGFLCLCGRLFQAGCLKILDGSFHEFILFGTSCCGFHTRPPPSCLHSFSSFNAAFLSYLLTPSFVLNCKSESPVCDSSSVVIQTGLRLAVDLFLLNELGIRGNPWLMLQPLPELTDWLR